MPGISHIASDGTILAGPRSELERATLEWQAHLDAGRLTAATDPGTAPEIAANRARTEAILIGPRRDRIW